MKNGNLISENLYNRHWADQS